MPTKEKGESKIELKTAETKIPTIDIHSTDCMRLKLNL